MKKTQVNTIKAFCEGKTIYDENIESFPKDQSNGEILVEEESAPNTQQEFLTEETLSYSPLEKARLFK